MRKVRFHTFNGIRYEIEIVGPVDGLCNAPKIKEPHLFICTTLKAKNGLVAVIHEALHACNYNTKEEKVEGTAKDIADFLWRLGYRYKK